jgi:hypothetical protein
VRRRAPPPPPNTHMIHTPDPAYVFVCVCACPVQVRAQEEVAAVRRRAAWVAREVGGFWAKADRVVNYKVGVLMVGVVSSFCTAGIAIQ